MFQNQQTTLNDLPPLRTQYMYMEQEAATAKCDILCPFE